KRDVIAFGIPGSISGMTVSLVVRGWDGPGKRWGKPCLRKIRSACLDIAGTARGGGHSSKPSDGCKKNCPKQLPRSAAVWPCHTHRVSVRKGLREGASQNLPFKLFNSCFQHMTEIAPIRIRCLKISQQPHLYTR